FQEQRFQNLVCRENYLYLQPSNPAYKAIYRINLSFFTYDSIPLPYEIIPTGVENELNSEKQDIAVIDKKGRYAYVCLYGYLLQIDLLTNKGRRITRIIRREGYALDDDDNIWVSSDSGLRIYEQNTLRMVKKIIHELGTHRLQIRSSGGTGLICLLNSKGVILYDYKNTKQYQLSLSDGLMTVNNSSIACVNNMLFVGAQLDALQYISLNKVINSTTERKCYLSGIQLFNQPYATDTLPEYLHSLILPHNKNFVTLTFSSTEFEKPEQLEYRYKLKGVDNDWVNTNYLNRTISYPDLKPGYYIFYTSIKNKDGSWNDNEISLQLTIIPAWWQTDWFKISTLILVSTLIFVLVWWRIKAVRKQEQQKSKIEKEILELEAKALRAQMNPHFIFNCLNSIKSLIQQNENEKSVTYLTTFSKLIRTLFNNADKKEISLYDEIETCKLYLQLEAMRFDDKLFYSVNIDESIDLKSIYVPALIIQPFIENAIWHGIVPRNLGGNVSLSVLKYNGNAEIIIEDDGIGRESSRQNKSVSGITHHSKGVNLTQTRLELDNLLQQRKAELEIIDKKDKNGRAAGTKVIIKLDKEI
ncbi:MAG: histidine kinase, partial [Chitinophagaceae bacterium]